MPRETLICPHRWLVTVAWTLAALLPLPASAGLSLDEALARQRLATTGDGSTPTLTPIGLDAGAADGVLVGVGGPGRDIPPLLRPALRGDGGLRLTTRSSAWDGRVQVRLGLAAEAGVDPEFGLDGSSVSIAFGVGHLYASVERRHWGPAWTGSLILDAAALPVPAVGWRKTEPTPFRSILLSWLGPWSADFFAGELSQRSGPRHAHLLGARIQVMPLPGLELGASRVMQWGGSGRDESLGSLWRALAGRDNVDSELPDDDPGNQLAGFDARYTMSIGDGRTLSVYGQGIGEDESHLRPSHYLGSVGVDTAFDAAGGRWRVFVEAADTSMNGAVGAAILGGAYRHHIYTDGYTQRGRPLGHPVGGDVRLASLGAFVAAGALSATAMLHVGRAYSTAQTQAPDSRLGGANVEASWRFDEASRLGMALFHWREGGSRLTRAQLWWQQALP